MELVLKYGYPFPEEAELLRSSNAEKGVHGARIDAYWVSMWIADIVRSAKEIRSQSLFEELDALCNVLEGAESHEGRMRGLSIG
jgi:hypothetical protein